MPHSTVIAIDGPSGSGKSTVARKLAQELGVLYIDTGAMFRALAYKAHQKNIALDSSDELVPFLAAINVEYGVSDNKLICIDGENLTESIREHHVSKLASIISQVPQVREFLLDFQRGLAKSKVCVMEGRDIGTVVFPDAFCKFFVTASTEVRSKRRLDQLKENGDSSVTLDQVIKDVKKRDESDMNREVAPLKQADDAQFVDTSELNLDQVIGAIQQKVLQKANDLGISW